jgi:hypothetical protein
VNGARITDEELALISCPVFLLHGSVDVLSSRDTVETLKEKLVNGTLFCLVRGQVADELCTPGLARPTAVPGGADLHVMWDAPSILSFTHASPYNRFLVNFVSRHLRPDESGYAPPTIFSNLGAPISVFSERDRADEEALRSWRAARLKERTTNEP